MPAITTAQIQALRTSAAEAGDMAMVATCEVALHGVDVDRSRAAATGDEWIAAIELGKRGARARCAEVIADAKAME